MSFQCMVVGQSLHLFPILHRKKDKKQIVEGRRMARVALPSPVVLELNAQTLHHNHQGNKAGYVIVVLWFPMVVHGVSTPKESNLAFFHLVLEFNLAAQE